MFERRCAGRKDRDLARSRCTPTWNHQLTTTSSSAWDWSFCASLCQVRFNGPLKSPASRLIRSPSIPWKWNRLTWPTGKWKLHSIPLAAACPESSSSLPRDRSSAGPRWFDQGNRRNWFGSLRAKSFQHPKLVFWPLKCLRLILPQQCRFFGWIGLYFPCARARREFWETPCTAHYSNYTPNENQSGSTRFHYSVISLCRALRSLVDRKASSRGPCFGWSDLWWQLDRPRSPLASLCSVWAWRTQRPSLVRKYLQKSSQSVPNELGWSLEPVRASRPLLFPVFLCWNFLGNAKRALDEPHAWISATRSLCDWLHYRHGRYLSPYTWSHPWSSAFEQSR